jgi:membrane-associated phospholipid phosphatase
MLSLIEQIKRCFIGEGLQPQLDESRYQFLSNPDDHGLKQLMITAAVCLGLAFLLWVIAGYHGAFHLLNQFTPVLPDGLWQWLTFMGDTTLVLCLTLLFARRNPAMLWVVFIAAVYGTLVVHGLKNLLDAVRPPVELDPGTYHLVGKALRNGSFPSGHSLTAFVFASVLFYFVRNRYLRIGLLIMAALAAISRVMVAAHWPVDVLVGSAFGMLVVVAAVHTARRYRWGISRPMHLFTVFLMVVAALMILGGHDGGYPAALLPAKLVAFSCLLVFVIEYFYPPKQTRN